MINFFRTYRTKPWPRLEVPAMGRAQLIGLIVYVALLIAAGWFVWGSSWVQVEYFLILGVAIPIFFFIKSPYVTLIGLLSFEVAVAFLFMGSSDFILMVVAGFAFSIIAFESPILMYLFLIVAMWVDITPVGFGHPARTTIVVGSGLLVGWLFKDILQPEKVKIKIRFPEVVPGLLYFFWFSMGFFFWCLDLELGWVQYKGVITSILIFSITPLVLNTESKLNWALIGWSGIGLIAAFAAFFAPSLGFEQPEATTWGTVYGAFGSHKNWISALMALSFFIIFAGFYWLKGTLIKIGQVFSMLFLFAGILYQQSRATASALGGGLLVFWLVDTFLNREKKGALRMLVRIFVLVGTAAILILGIYVLDLGQLTGGYESMFYSPQSSNTMIARLMIWGASAEMIAKEHHAIRGLGPGAFWTLGNQYGVEGITGASTEEFLDMHPHCLYLDLFLHVGVLGLLLFLWISISVLIKLWGGYRKFRDPKYRYLCLGLFCSILAFLAHGVLEFQYYNITTYWAYLGMSIAVLNIGRAKEAQVPAADTARV